MIKSITGDREFQEKLFNISIAMLTVTYHMKMRGASQNNLIKEKENDLRRRWHYDGGLGCSKHVINTKEIKRQKRTKSTSFNTELYEEIGDMKERQIRQEQRACCKAPTNLKRVVILSSSMTRRKIKVLNQRDIQWILITFSSWLCATQK